MSALRGSCFLLETATSRGTGYLVAPRKVATCEHVVRAAGNGGAVTVCIDAETRVTGRVLKVDAITDCAIVELDAEIPNATPLKLARVTASKAPWEGFGFPALPRAGGGPPQLARVGITYLGLVTEVDARNLDHRPRIALYSDMLAAGMAEPQAGISGGPVTVDGAVIGHFASVFSTAAAPGKPTMGLVFAARSEDVLALLGDEASVSRAPDVTVSIPEPGAPPVADGGYHAFISYRSTDRAFAVALADRLEGLKFRVFLDQRELVPGDRFANALGAALDRSQNGIVLVSRGWVESPWCQDEANEMLRRSNEPRSAFRVIPLLLDGTKPPGFFAGIQSLDFTKEEVPVGDKLDQLAWALRGTKPPPAESTEAKVTATMTEATDKANAEVELVGGNPKRVRPLLKAIEQLGVPHGAAVLTAVARLIGAGHFADALALLPAKPEALRERQLKALALSKLKRNDEALDLLEPMAARAELDAETGGILGGTYRRRWLASGMTDGSALLRAYEIYRRTWARTGDTYPGINVAALGTLLDEPEAPGVAARVAEILGAKSEKDLDGWDEASLADALLITGEAGQARKWYRACASDFHDQPANIAVVRVMTRLLVRKLEQTALEMELPKLLCVPRVVAFSGHMTDAPGRAVARFPEAKAEAARREIRRRLQELGGRVTAVCSGARGGDLLFAEQVLDLAGSVHLVLPFPERHFLETSVASAEWVKRFEQVVAHRRSSVETLRQDVPAAEDEPAAYEAANDAILGRAVELAATFDDANPILLTLWNEAAGDGRGGTAGLVESWRARDVGEHVNVDPRSL